MNAQEILDELAQMGSEGTKKVLLKHGAVEPIFGVKVGDMKKIQKIVKKNYQLALDLFETGNSDARYLAGLIADEKLITKADLQNWAEKANWSMLSEYTVAQLAAETPHGMELAREWILSDKENIASSGWSTWSNIVALKPDIELDMTEISQLLDTVQQTIHQSQNRVRYTMNGFVISVGCYIAELSEKALEIAQKIGKVQVNVGDTACKVPLATDYILKVTKTGQMASKKKEARC